MKKSPIALAVIVLCSYAYGGGAAFNSSYHLGSFYSLHTRTLFYEFQDNRLETGRANALSTIGVVYGKNFKCTSFLRLVLDGEVSYGTVVVDTLEQQLLDDGTRQDLLIFNQYLIPSLQSGMEFPFLFSRGAVCLYGGIGLNITRFAELERLKRDHSVRITDSLLEDNLTASLNPKVRFSFEHYFSNLLGVSLSYSVKVWTPLAYGSQKDLFPLHAIDFSEHFVTHSIELRLMANR